MMRPFARSLLRAPRVRMATPKLSARYISTSTTRDHSTLAISSSSSASHALHPPTHDLPQSSIFRPLDTFTPRHIGPRASDVDAMLGSLGYTSMESFISETVPSDIRIKEVSDADVKPFSELELMRRAERLAEMNRPMKSYIGMGYHNSIVPPVIQRNVSRWDCCGEFQFVAEVRERPDRGNLVSPDASLDQAINSASYRFSAYNSADALFRSSKTRDGTPRTRHTAPNNHKVRYLLFPTDPFLTPFTGRLESLINYQTVITSLTGLPMANASLLDEATAAAEAMAMCLATSPRSASPGVKKTYLVSSGVSIATLAVLRTRAKGFGIKIRVVEDAKMSETIASLDAKTDSCIGMMLQYPDVNGGIQSYESLTAQAQKAGLKVVVATDLLALTMLKPPGEWGADIALGNSARFGVPAGYGGPHAAFFACSDALKRKMPGRLVGVSRDTRGEKAYRLALQSEFIVSFAVS